MIDLTLCVDELQTTVLVEQEIFIIGRLPECQLSLPNGPVSRHHARIMRVGSDFWTLTDLGSTNGTYLNNHLIDSTTILHDDDAIRIGNITIKVQLKKRVEEASEEGRTLIYRDARELQQQWINATDAPTPLQSESDSKDQIIDRLKELVNIARTLSAAPSIEEIFAQVQEVVFRYLSNIDRLALLIDVHGTGALELVKAGTRDPEGPQTLPEDGSWISRSICRSVFSQHVAVQTADTQADKRFSNEKSIFVKQIRSAIAVPLWDEDRVIGVLYGDAKFSAQRRAQEDESELSFFSALANIVASSVQRWLLMEKLRREETIRHHLERYHSPSVVKELTSLNRLPNGRLRPTEMEISVLFADLVGFTAISERLKPMEIAHLLNNLFEEMITEVFAHEGTLDKYVGDGLMAFFGAPEPKPDHALRAVATAHGMLSRLARLNQEKFWQEPLSLRIAVNSGKAVVGDVGSSQRMDYTALGAAINLAARMEQICPPGECVLSETTYNLLPNRSDFSCVGDFSFKGIERLVRVYRFRNQEEAFDGRKH